MLERVAAVGRRFLTGGTARRFRVSSAPPMVSSLLVSFLRSSEEMAASSALLSVPRSAAASASASASACVCTFSRSSSATAIARALGGVRSSSNDGGVTSLSSATSEAPLRHILSALRCTSLQPADESAFSTAWLLLCGWDDDACGWRSWGCAASLGSARPRAFAACLAATTALARLLWVGLATACAIPVTGTMLSSCSPSSSASTSSE
mmetsp:Transcript_7004/g.22989  ORF Transcript_7004/g.22989 Transcript_7004/m.22989 type:complete len:209 (-) Transcript_7004:805-1431(-)|eukprot:scaffold26293_cov112-Isochrysis_galbana.AAC.8